MNIKDFYDASLAQPLLAFVFAYYLVVIIWSEIRKNHPQVLSSAGSLTPEDKKRIQKVRIYKALTLGFISIVLCFAFNPVIYKDFLPLHIFDTPMLNILGIGFLASSLILLVTAQSDIDAELHRNKVFGTTDYAMDWTGHGKKIVTGYFLMFLGITMILTSIVSIALLLVACLVSIKKR